VQYRIMWGAEAGDNKLHITSGNPSA